MVPDRTLMYVALILVIIGIIGLFVVTQFIGNKEVKIEKITVSEVGQNVAVKGVVNSFYVKDGNIFMDINDSSIIKVIMFESIAKNMPEVYSIKKGDSVIVEGKVQLYKNELEIVASSVKRI